eukprot:2523248-Pyramimonas_sp.AAC.1
MGNAEACGAPRRLGAVLVLAAAASPMCRAERGSSDGGLAAVLALAPPPPPVPQAERCAALRGL